MDNLKKRSIKNKKNDIQEAYEYAGLVWDEIHSMVNMNDGTIIINELKLKSTLTGFDNAVFKKVLNIIKVTNKGIWLELVSLSYLKNMNK